MEYIQHTSFVTGPLEQVRCLLRSLQHPRVARVSALLFCLGIFVLHTVTGYLQVQSYTFGKMDSALYLQGLWLIGHFQNPVSLAYAGYFYNVYLGQHVMPIAFLFGLLLSAGPPLVSEIVLEGLSYSIAVYLVFKSCNIVFHSLWLSLALAIVYWAAFTPVPGHFYFENLAAPAFALAAYWTLREDYKLATIAWLVVPLYKEYFAIASLVIGLIIFAKTRQRIGLVLSVVSLSYFLIAFLVVEPWAQPRNADVDLFSYLGSSPLEIISNLFLKPQLWLGKVLNPATITYLLGLLAPFAGTALLSPTIFLPGLPILGLNILLPGTQGIDAVTGHYSTPLLPLFAVSGIAGLKRLRDWIATRNRRFRFVWLIVSLVVVISALTGVRYHLYYLKDAMVGYQILSQHTSDVRTAISLIPSATSVATSDQLMPSFSARPQLVNLGNFSFQRPAYVVLDEAYETCLPQMVADALASKKSSTTQSCYKSEDWYAHFLTSGEKAKWQAAGYQIMGHWGSVVVLQDQTQSHNN